MWPTRKSFRTGTEGLPTPGEKVIPEVLVNSTKMKETTSFSLLVEGVLIFILYYYSYCKLLNTYEQYIKYFIRYFLLINQYSVQQALYGVLRGRENGLRDVRTKHILG